MTPQYPEMQRMARYFKEKSPRAKIIVGGPHPSALPIETLQENPDIDFLCKGEGERTFEEFLDCLSGKGDFTSVAGLYLRTKDGIVFTTPRGLMNARELDDCIVDWETILKHGVYFQKVLYNTELIPVLPIITTRGCPFECTFCDEGNIWERKPRSRSVDSVINEMVFLKDKYAIYDFNILDDTFTLNKKRFTELCKKIASLNIRFRITARVKSVDPDMLLELKLAGCQTVAYGVESGDNSVLQRMKKHQTVDDVRHAFKITREAGLQSYALCMVGNMGEDFFAVTKTRDLLRQIDPDFFSVSLMTPYPGSANYSECIRNGWILHKDWKLWVPSVMKTTGYTPPGRTDVMTPNEMLKAYFYMNRFAMQKRFGKKYGRFYPLKPAFYLNEIFPRIKTIGIRTFIKYLSSLLVRGRS
jgi:anaerobic magnesium-protoporphyrin IX monomethyl ester cyclase